MYTDESHGPHRQEMQEQPSPPQTSSPPPDNTVAPTEIPTTPSNDSAVAGYAKVSKVDAEVGVVREQETLEQQQARKEGFANLLSKSMPPPSPELVKPAVVPATAKATSSRTFNVDAAEEDSKARWNEIQAKMNSKKPK